MKALIVLGIIIAVAVGTFYLAGVVQNQDKESVLPPTTTPPLTETNGHSLTPQGGTVPLNPSEVLTLQELFKKVENSVVQITTRGDIRGFTGDALGSGFVFDGDGHIITNNHVVENSNRIDVTFLDGTVYRAKLIGTDPYADLAVIRVEVPKEKLFPLPLADSSKLQVGDQVVAIGNPFGLSGSMTTGIVSQLGRLLPLTDSRGFSIPDVIQTDAAINPGNSGGSLLNLKAEVVGINTAITSSTGEFSGIGLAVPSSTAKKIVPALIKDGVFKHPWLGVSGRDVTPEVGDALDLNEAKGFLVIDVVADGPADNYGIQGGDKLVSIDGEQIRLGGDVIVGIDDQSVRKIDDILVYLERETSVGDEVKLSVIRDGKTIVVLVTLGERPNPAESP